MAETSAGVVDPARGPGTGGLEPNAIGVVQDTVIGMASSAPAATVGLTLASLAATTAYGSGPILLLTAIPMLIIANAYRRLNMWNAHAGASFEWVGRAISPYLGFLTGWLMVVAYIIGTVSAVEVIGPSVITVFGGTDTPGKDFAIAAAVGLVMLVIAIVGIKITARKAFNQLKHQRAGVADCRLIRVGMDQGLDRAGLQIGERGHGVAPPV